MGERVEQGRLIDRWRVRRGGKLIFAETLRLDGAIAEALARNSPHPHTVRLVLERNRPGQSLPVPLPQDPRIRDLAVRPHDLATYDISPEDSDDDDFEH